MHSLVCKPAWVACARAPARPRPPQVRRDKRFRLAVGTFKEDCSNYVEIITCKRL